MLGAQGQITQLGFKEQAASYTTMAAATASAATQEQTIASQTDQLATETQAAGKQAQQGDFISAAIKGVTAVASMAANIALPGSGLL